MGANEFQQIWRKLGMLHSQVAVVVSLINKWLLVSDGFGELPFGQTLSGQTQGFQRYQGANA